MDARLTIISPPEARHRIASHVLTAPALEPHLGGIRLMPHQIEAAARLLSLLDEHGGALLADSTGMGKTFVALAVARMVGDAVVIAPAALRTMWQDALRQANLVAAFLSYEALSRGAVDLAITPRLLVVDEAHHARNPATQRYRELALLAWGRRVLLLSATPIHNRATDLHALLALFLGSRARALSMAACSTYIVRRSPGDRDGSATPRGSREPGLPRLAAPRWLPVEHNDAVVKIIRTLPPAVPPVDGGTAHGLLTLGLIRAWCSSTSALRAMLLRRLQRGAAMADALEDGRHPSRAELSSWSVVDSAVQLVLPGLLVGHRTPEWMSIAGSIRHHCDAVRALVRSLEDDRADAQRADFLRTILRENAPDAVVAFTQYSETAVAMYRACRDVGAVALVTGRGARIASGRLTTDAVVRAFDGGAGSYDPRLPLRLLVASDVLSEGLSLRRPRILVHLDLPWTMARLEQRVGRIRRTGSPHREVSVYAIGPPIGARSLTSLIRVLQRKARLTSVSGLTTEPGEMPLLGERLHRATRRMAGQADAQASETIRGIMSTWTDPSAVGDPVTGSSVAVVPTARQAIGRPWSALAAVIEGGVVRLLSLDPEGVSDRPSDVLGVVRQAETPVSHSDPAGDQDAAHVDAAVRQLDEWLWNERGRKLVAPATEAPSAPHADVLRFLDASHASAPRSARPVVLPSLQRCRQLVLATRGAGAELVLARWLEAHHESRGAQLPGAIRALTDDLSSRAVVRQCGADASGTSWTMLVLTGSHP